MSTKDYYAIWLKMKESFKKTLAEDARLQELAINYIGIKPQSNAVETVARVYGKYCELYNKICDCYDQMTQVQRRPYIKIIIDALACRIIELKETLQSVEVYEYTYTDNACQQLLITPFDVEIICPFFYSFEMRQAEMQYIMDQIYAGNRIGDPTPTASESELLEQKKREEEERLQEEKEADIRRKMALGIEIDVESDTCVLTPQELEEKRLREEYEGFVFNIQRMERARCITKAISHKKYKDENMYLELAGLKKPAAKEALRRKACALIQHILRQYMKLKREHYRENKVKERLDMVISSFKPQSAKVQLEKVKETRRKFRQAYYEKWMEKKLTEKTRILKFKEGDIMEDISDEIRQWFCEWFEVVRVFDEFPYPEEGGSILIVKGETFTIEEYIEWKEAEEKRLKAEAGAKKTKEQIKAEKLAAKEEKKRLALEARDKEARRLLDYKKSRFNPDSDPGVYINIGEYLENLGITWASYETQWKDIDEPDADKDAIKGYIMKLVTEDAYQDVQLQLRPVVDEVMRLELDILKKALKADYDSFGGKIPVTLKRKKPKKFREPKPEKISPQVMFQSLADEGIVRQYPRVTLDDFWGDRNYAAADCRGIAWTPTFPPPSIGDVKEQVKIRCLLSLGADSEQKTQLIVGPKGCGKKTLVYAVATESNALLIDLSPFSVYNKFPGPKNTKTLWTYIYKISRLMQPTIILVDKADKLFYKAVPAEEKKLDPTRLSRDFFKEIVKPLKAEDKILVLGTASEPWLSAKAKMLKVFPEVILFPRTDYGSLSFILKKMLMEYHGVDREFNIQSVAQTLRGYGIDAIIKVVTKLLAGKRMAELAYRPLKPEEILQAVMENETSVYLDPFDYQMYTNWYMSYSRWGPKAADNKLMLESQYIYHLKALGKK